MITWRILKDRNTNVQEKNVRLNRHMQDKCCSGKVRSEWSFMYLSLLPSWWFRVNFFDKKNLNTKWPRVWCMRVSPGVSESRVTDRPWEAPSADWSQARPGLAPPQTAGSDTASPCQPATWQILIKEYLWLCREGETCQRNILRIPTITVRQHYLKVLQNEILSSRLWKSSTCLRRLRLTI